MEIGGRHSQSRKTPPTSHDSIPVTALLGLGKEIKSVVVVVVERARHQTGQRRLAVQDKFFDRRRGLRGKKGRGM